MTDHADSGADLTTHETPRVLVFFDYACPFCYLDWPRFKQLRTEHEAELVLVPFELRPDLEGGHVPASRLGVGHSERVEEHMRKMADEGGLALAFPDFVPNTHAALALGEYARDRGPQVHEAVHVAIFSAYNGSGLDISLTDTLLEIAENSGLDRLDVAAALSEGRYDERLHQFRHLAMSFGITATPSALICNELFIGSRPYEVLVDALERCLVTEHTIATHRSETHGQAAGEGAP